MKKNRTTRLIVLILFLAIVTAVIISGTFAKYTTSSDAGSATATVARWSFSANGLGQFSRTDGVGTDKIASEKLAPGTKGSFNIEIDATGCEVGIDYEIVINNITHKPTNLKFYSDDSYSHEISLDGSDYKLTGTLPLSEITETPTKQIPIYWQWEYETLDGDTADTADGEAANEMSFSVSVVGTQTNPQG